MISDSLPTDLITEILSRLPAKSLARFRSVSKQWASIIDQTQFKHLFLTKSSSHPRLTFAIEEKGLWSIFSSPQQHLIPHDDKASSSSSSLVVTPEFHMKFPPGPMRIFRRGDRQFACGYASGKSYSFFGFDPVGKQYKVLHVAYPCGPDDHRVMTLGARGARWRKVDCSLGLVVKMSEGICINGVLYYLGDTNKFRYVIACFDVRSEKFSFLYPESLCELINYNGKLGVVYYDDLSDDAIELRVWVLEDVEKQEWSKYAYALKVDKLFPSYVSAVGVISTGEIVLSMADYTSRQPFYVYYFNPEGNTIRRFEIQGFGEYHGASNDPRRVHVFVDDCSRSYRFADHVEDLNVKDPTLLKSSIYVPYVYNEESEEDEEYEVNNGRRFRGKKKRG
ncbi:hypothetical protein YC2023_039671 [Brassica napus]